MGRNAATLRVNHGEKVKPNYAKLAEELGRLVNEKQQAYGNSAGNTGYVLRILYPNGISTDAYRDAMLVVRVLDKLNRIANASGERDPMGESPWKDIAGYGLLGWAMDEGDK